MRQRIPKHLRDGRILCCASRDSAEDRCDTKHHCGRYYYYYSDCSAGDDDADGADFHSGFDFLENDHDDDDVVVAVVDAGLYDYCDVLETVHVVPRESNLAYCS